MLKPKIILSVGMSNSGKSTYAKEFINTHRNFIEVNRDELRIYLFLNSDASKYHTYRFNKQNEDLVTKVQYQIAEFALGCGKGVFVSDTNLNPATRRGWEHLSKKYKVSYEEMPFIVDLHVAKNRNQQRGITLPEHVLDRQFAQMRGYLGLPTYEGTKGKPKAVIFDLDGTLFDMTGLRNPFEWDKVHLDKPRPHVVMLARMLELEGYTLLFMSGRDGCCRKATWDSLEEHVTEPEWLFMRKEGDNRPDCQVKDQMFWENVAPNFDVKFVVDDRKQMVDHWRAIGLECWQVQSGNF